MGALLSSSKGGGKRTSSSAAGTPVVVGEVVPQLAGSVGPADTSNDSGRPHKASDTCNDGGRPQLDLVFTMDCTGSMGSYIQSAKRNIEAIVSRLVQSEGYDLRFSLVAYRDHPPQDMTYVTKPFPFTAELAQMQSDLSTLSAQGGGDGPEAVGAALKATLEQEWRATATKVCVLIADAPPHGLGERGDGFPNGAPDGVDPLEVLEQMSMRGICLYSVGCEPAISNYQHAKAFLIAAAQKTNGQAVSLGSAAALAEVIMGGAIEEMDLEQLSQEVVTEWRSLKAARPSMDDEELQQAAWERINARGHKTRHMETKKLSSKHASLVLKSSSLSAARESLKSVPPPKSSVHAAPSARRGCARLAAVPTVSAAAYGCRLESADFDKTFVDTDAYSASEDDEYGGIEDAAESGVRLSTRALSFTQMSRMVGRQKAMGVL